MLRSKLIGQLLNTIRELSNLPQQELANKLNVDRTLISKIENGKASIAPDILANWIDLTYEGWKSAVKERQLLEQIRDSLNTPHIAI